MAFAIIRRLSTGIFPIAALGVLLLASLYMLSNATQQSERFGEMYSWLLLINILELILLIILIGTNLTRLIRQYRAQATGSRLAIRLVTVFVILSLAPVSVVYFFSLDFLRHGIDSWFDVRFEKALSDSLELSRTALEDRLRDMQQQSSTIAHELMASREEERPQRLQKLRKYYGIEKLVVMTLNNEIVYQATAGDPLNNAYLLDKGIIAQLQNQQSYSGLDTLPDVGLHVRAIVPMPDSNGLVLQSLNPVDDRMGQLTNSVQTAYARYEQLSFLREPLKLSFIVTLSLVLLLSMLAAVWAAFFSAQRLVAPIRTLSIGTRAVAAGDYDKRLPQVSNDELGFLVQSFNEMTRKIALARDEAEHSQHLIEAQRAYLGTVLESLSSGVLTLEADMTIRTINRAALDILGIKLADATGHQLSQFTQQYPHLEQFINVIAPYLTGQQADWHEQMILFGASGRQVLICRGTPLPSNKGGAGHVIIFDDITALIQAQRDAAWGEVARRLAHEIKNPLTPIQLSAERLRHKYLPHMTLADADLLDRSTHTIIQQVEVLKEMVKAFSDYARTPKLELSPADLASLTHEVLDLYRSHTPVKFSVESEAGLPPITVDSGRFRQLLHNLIKNSLEAIATTGGKGEITVGLRRVEEPGFSFLEIRVRDNGPGFPKEIIDKLFEPYITSKPRGSGLGLAIVKKIVEEHSGVIWAENLAEGGACVVIRVPWEIGRHEHPDRAGSILEQIRLGSEAK